MSLVLAPASPASYSESNYGARRPQLCRRPRPRRRDKSARLQAGHDRRPRHAASTGYPRSGYLGDSRGYVPSGFRHGGQVQIVGFTEPFKDGESDHIVEVTDGTHDGWVKPSNIQRARNERPGGTPHDKRHLDLRKRVHPAAAELLERPSRSSWKCTSERTGSLQISYRRG